jgi:hypothetical protein
MLGFQPAIEIVVCNNPFSNHAQGIAVGLGYDRLSAGVKNS